MKYKRDEINELLVDYLENDISEGLKKDLDLVIKNSHVREKSFKALNETRKIVRGSEPKMPELSEAFFNQLHGKIMDRVSTEKPRNPVRLWFEEQSWRNYAAAAVVVLFAGTVFFNLLRPSVKFQSAGILKSDSMLLSISLEVPEAFADSLMNDRDTTDFYKDAAAEKVAKLGEKGASELMNQLGE